MTKQEEYQTVIITLSDGREGKFTGRKLVDLSDDGIAKVIKIKFTESKPLPNGYEFEELKEANHDQT